ncbi:MAG: hypothetical protein Q8O41_11555 [Candidatus Methanoperedens sp.]|nr:hypothetical protein [Candidatus Methanoperedens sp.]
MKYKFIVDENIFYCALRGVDEHDNKDFSSAKFLTYLLKNCHTIYLDIEYSRRYENNIPNKLERISNNKKEPILPGIDTIIQNIFRTSEKIIRDFSDSLEFPCEKDHSVKLVLGLLKYIS